MISAKTANAKSHKNDTKIEAERALLKEKEVRVETKKMMDLLQKKIGESIKQGRFLTSATLYAKHGFHPESKEAVVSRMKAFGYYAESDTSRWYDPVKGTIIKWRVTVSWQDNYVNQTIK